MMHPGLDTLSGTYDWKYHWREELAAVTGDRVRQHIHENNIKLISFRELAHE